MNHRRHILHGLLLALSVSGACAEQAAQPTPTPAIVIAEPTAALDASQPAAKTGSKGKDRFLQLHESFLKRGKEGPVGLLFLGDSITYQFPRQAPKLWEESYGKYQPANFGIGGDLTQHLIWRIENGELEGLDPKVTVLLIGTNNTSTHTAEQILAANTRIVQMVREKLPKTKILLLGIFPRGPRSPDKNGVLRDDGVTRMAIIDKVNEGMAGLDDGRTVRFLNINPVFLGPDGKIPNDVMPDQLHPNEKGYKLWAEAMNPLLTQMLQEK